MNAFLQNGFKYRNNLLLFDRNISATPKMMPSKVFIFMNKKT